MPLPTDVTVWWIVVVNIDFSEVYLVQANLDSMATHLWAHRNISSRLSMTVAPNFSRAVNHYLRLDCVANDTSLLAILDGTVAILAYLLTLHTLKTTV